VIQWSNLSLFFWWYWEFELQISCFLGRNNTIWALQWSNLRFSLFQYLVLRMLGLNWVSWKFTCWNPNMYFRIWLFLTIKILKVIKLTWNYQHRPPSSKRRNVNKNRYRVWPQEDRETTSSQKKPTTPWLHLGLVRVSVSDAGTTQSFVLCHGIPWQTNTRGHKNKRVNDHKTEPVREECHWIKMLIG
jgi:hypothetical protein